MRAFSKKHFSNNLQLLRFNLVTHKYYLFNGTQIQRNYACLFLNRLGEREPVKEAFEQGLIDEIQAFSR